jgi:hypothetical protein
MPCSSVSQPRFRRTYHILHRRSIPFSLHIPRNKGHSPKFSLILCSKSVHCTKLPLCEILFLSLSNFLAHSPQRIYTVRAEFCSVICRNGTDYEQSFEMFYCERWNFIASLLAVTVCFLFRTRLLVGTSSLVYAGHPS